MSKKEIVSRLTAADKKTFAKHEETIRGGLSTFIEVGHALADIRDSELYREDFPTFEAYCSDRWDLQRSVAYNRIAAAEVVDEILNVQKSGHVPLAESHALELAKAKEKAPKVWAEVVKKSPKLADGTPCTTAKKIAAIRDSILKPKVDDSKSETSTVKNSTKAESSKKSENISTSHADVSSHSKAAAGATDPTSAAATSQQVDPIDQARDALRSLSSRLDAKHSELKALADEVGKLPTTDGFKKLHGSGGIVRRIDDAAMSCKSAAANIRNATPQTPAQCTTCKGKGHACKDCGGDGWQSNEERRDADNRRTANAPHGATA